MSAHFPGLATISSRSMFFVVFPRFVALFHNQLIVACVLVFLFVGFLFLVSSFSSLRVLSLPNSFMFSFPLYIRCISSLLQYVSLFHL